MEQTTGTLESLDVMSFWKNKRVLITGHTGFKGSWLSLWLKECGADVYGISLEPQTSPSLFSILGTEPQHTFFADIQDFQTVSDLFKKIQPDIVFHLAAQALVKPSYSNPLETFSTNVMGTAHVLEAIRQTPSVKTALIVSSDKCYEPSGTNHAFVETDPMGGHDPYSASKGCTELVTASYFHSFFKNHSCKLISARAGNVIGGGDWSADRLVPDIVRAVYTKVPLVIRNPLYVRPWQHVLDLTQGYVDLVQKTWEGDIETGSAWNFGPLERVNVTVKEVVEFALHVLGKSGEQSVRMEPAVFYENPYLALNSEKSHTRLNWTPKLSVETTLEWTFQWYSSYYGHQDMIEFTKKQLQSYWKKSL